MNGLSAVRRLLLLDTYDEPPRPFGAAGQVDFLADVRWDACDFSAHAPHRLHGHAPAGVYLPARPRLGDNEPPFRSEEHTSELQSLMRISYAVFCLKKKTTNKQTYTLISNT